MIHPDTILTFISSEKGLGVIATHFIPKGTITWVKDKLDRVFTPKNISNMTEVHRQLVDRYCYRDHKGNYILCWDHGKYINHSFNSNCLTTPYDFEIAIRDIQEGEELTDDYGYLNIEKPFRPIPEKGSKRRTVRPDDLLRYANIWDEKIKNSIPFINEVNQPLEPFLSKKTKSNLDMILDNKKKMDSILKCYYNQKKKNYE